MLLTNDNYFSAHEYMSASTFKAFLDCEAAAMAQVAGKYQREDSSALLVGSYVDAHFSGEGDLFRAEHPEIFTKAGALRSEFTHAEEIISRIEREPLAMMMLNGEKQKILTGDIDGVPFRGKLDVLLSEEQCEAIATAYPAMEDLLFAHGAIVDLKIVRDFHPLYKEDEGRISFIEYWRYDLQLAIYQRLAGGQLPCYILAASKEKVPDLGLFLVPQSLLDAALNFYLPRLARITAVRDGLEEPMRCEHCTYCRQTKVMTSALAVGDWQ